MAIALTAESLAEIVASMNVRVAALQKAMENAGAADMSPTSWPASRKKAAIQVMEPIGKARDFMRGILHKECKGSERPLLQSLFGDCAVVSRIHVVIDLVVQMLECSHLRNDPRLQDARAACGAVEAVLKESGLGAALARARAEAEQKIDDGTHQAVRDASRSKMQSFGVTSERKPLETDETSDTASAPGHSHVSIPVSTSFRKLSGHNRLQISGTLDTVSTPGNTDVSIPVRTPPTVSARARATTAVRLKMFADLDEAETDAEQMHAVEMIFMSYDSTGSGILEGADYDACISDIVRHIQKEADEVAQKRGVRTLLPDDDALRRWVITVVDPNEDGAITFEEAAIGFKAVVDDIETGEDYEVRKRASMASVGLSLLAEES